MFILVFLLFIVVVIPTFTLGMAFIWEIIKFLGMLVTVLFMGIVEFVIKPLYNGLKKLFVRKEKKEKPIKIKEKPIKIKGKLIKGSE